MNQFKFHGYIYITINQQNKICYVGQKSISPEKSKNYLGSGSLFQEAVKKYGKKFFKKIILGEIFSNTIEDFKKQLNECETECIYFFRAYGSDGMNIDYIYGYNLTREGGSKLGTKDSFEIKNKKSIANKNRYEDPKEREKTGIASHRRFIDNPNLYTIYRDASLKKNKECPELVIKRATSLKETYKKEGQIEKHSKAQKLSYQQNPKRGENLSISLLNYNINHPETNEIKSNKMKQFYIDKPEERQKRSQESKERYQDDEYRKKQGDIQKQSYKNNPERKEKLLESHKIKREAFYEPIIQYTKEGIFIKEYQNHIIAKRELNIQHIVEVLKGKRKSCGGFIWKYKKDI
jgi:hypothetical protein